VLLAASPLVEGLSGRYFEDCNEAQTCTREETSSVGWPPTRSTRPTPSGSGKCPCGW
jgi:hypothetical protein